MKLRIQKTNEGGSRPSFSRFLSAEHGLTALLCSLILLLVTAYPLSRFALGRLFLNIFFSLVMISGVLSVYRRHVWRILLPALGALNIIIRWASHLAYENTFVFENALLAFLFLGALEFLLLKEVAREGPITGHRVRGAIAAYLVLGAIWAVVYQLVQLLIPGAFALPLLSDHAPYLELQGNLLYFSFITLATVGYGDIVAIHPVARALVMSEALIGQLFPAVILAGLVSLAIEHKKPKH